jgi:hypothetical protein
MIGLWPVLTDDCSSLPTLRCTCTVHKKDVSAYLQLLSFSFLGAAGTSHCAFADNCALAILRLAALARSAACCSRFASCCSRSNAANAEDEDRGLKHWPRGLRLAYSLSVEDRQHR